MSGMYPQLYAYLAGEVDDALPDMDRMMESRIVDWQQIMKLYEKLKNALLTCEERYIEAEEAPGKAAAGAENILQFQGDRRIMQIEQRTTLRGTGPRDNKRNRERKNPMKHRRLVTLALVVVLVSGMIVWAGAANTLQEIKAYLNYGVTVKYEGEAQKFYDANGKQVYPITYEGTTYLPLRALGNLLGLNVDWNQATKTVLLDEPSGVPLFEELDSYANVGGQQYKNSPTQISGFDVSNYARVRTDGYWGPMANISFNVMGKYDTLAFKVYSDIDCNLKVLGDNGSVLLNKDLTGAQVAQDVTVDLLETNQLTFQIEQHETAGYTYFFDARLDP